MNARQLVFVAYATNERATLDVIQEYEYTDMPDEVLYDKLLMICKRGY